MLPIAFGLVLVMRASDLWGPSTASAFFLADASEERMTMFMGTVKDLLVFLIPFGLWLVATLLNGIVSARGIFPLADWTQAIVDSWHWLGFILAGVALIAIPYVSPVNIGVGEVQGFGIRRDSDGDVTGYQMELRSEAGSTFSVEVDRSVYLTLKQGDRVRVEYLAWGNAAVTIDVLDGAREGMGWTGVPNFYVFIGSIALAIGAGYPLVLKVMELRRARSAR
jgi:hypothetical protein